MNTVKLFILSCALVIIACDNTPTHHQLDANAVVLALGDSLTEGYGAQLEESYPNLLDRQMTWTVINAGVSGDTSAQALERLPELLTTYQPDLVIVSIGGNDFLQQINESATKANIEQILTLSQESGAQVLLIGVPQLSLRAALGFPKDHEMYENLAKEYQVALLSNAWSDILGKEALRYDDIHPNAKGYALFAQTLLRELESLGWY